MKRSIPRLRHLTPRRRRAYQPQAEGLEGRVLLNAGDLDTTTFNPPYGYVLPALGYATTVQIDSSQNILAAGASGNSGSAGDFRVVRMTPTGALDSSFGSGGSATTDFAGRDDQANDMAIQTDGHIVVAGVAGDVEARTVRGKTTYYLNNDFGLVRYNVGVSGKADGSLDTTFGNNGKVTTNISTYTSTDTYNKRDDAYSIAVQADGKILVGGRTWTSSTIWQAALVRY